MIRLFLISFSGVWLGGYGLILAENADQARQQVIEQGIEGYYPDEVYEVTDISDKLREVGDATLIWNGDY